MNITFHGAAHEVTGSCSLVDTGTHKILVDCGMTRLSSFAGFGRVREMTASRMLPARRKKAAKYRMNRANFCRKALSCFKRCQKRFG